VYPFDVLNDPESDTVTAGTPDDNQPGNESAGS
jgi:hypothetical protein